MDNACQLLREGAVIILPTETVYGLACDASNPQAIAKIFAIKKRAATKPLQIMVGDLSQALELGEFNDYALDLAKQFWPGALTIIVKRRQNTQLCADAFCGLGTIGLRIPDHPIMQDLLREIEMPLAMTSANISGEEDCILGQEIPDEITSKVALIIDDGQSDIGQSSTVIDCSGDRAVILREGAVVVGRT